MKKLALFASGGGTNAIQIIEHLRSVDSKLVVDCIVCNNPQAGIIEKATALSIEVLLIDKLFFKHDLAHLLTERKVDYIALAGFLWLIPSNITTLFHNKIVNIHPSLLPKYGGKGMHGIHVHSAVIKHKEKESGITIHYVNENFDDGEIIFQAKCPVKPTDIPEKLAERVLKLEHLHFPKIIQRLWG